MRITFVDASAGSVASGSESIILNLCLQFSKRHDVVLITGIDSYQEALSHIKNASFKTCTVPFISRFNPRNEEIRSLFRLPLQYDVEAISFFLNFLRNIEARRLIKKSDVVSFHYPMTSLLFSQYLKFKRIPSVFHCPGHVNGRLFFKFNMATLYLANSLITKNRVMKLTHRMADGVVTPGINLPRSSSSLPHEPTFPVLLCVSRLTRAKGVYNLLEIFRYVKKDIAQATLILVGHNFEGEILLNKIKSLGLSDSVRLTGQVPFDEVKCFYENAHILVHPSTEESFGLVVLEAMSYGLPVVAADIPAAREVAKNVAFLLPYKTNNDYWPPELYRIWANQIVNILRNSPSFSAKSEKGKEIALSQTWENKAAEYEVFLLDAIQRIRHG